MCCPTDLLQHLPKATAPPCPPPRARGLRPRHRGRTPRRRKVPGVSAAAPCSPPGLPSAGSARAPPTFRRPCPLPQASPPPQPWPQPRPPFSLSTSICSASLLASGPAVNLRYTGGGCRDSWGIAVGFSCLVGFSPCRPPFLCSSPSSCFSFSPPLPTRLGDAKPGESRHACAKATTGSTPVTPHLPAPPLTGRPVYRHPSPLIPQSSPCLVLARPVWVPAWARRRPWLCPWPRPQPAPAIGTRRAHGERRMRTLISDSGIGGSGSEVLGSMRLACDGGLEQWSGLPSPKECHNLTF